MDILFIFLNSFVFFQFDLQFSSCQSSLTKENQFEEYFIELYYAYILWFSIVENEYFSTLRTFDLQHSEPHLSTVRVLVFSSIVTSCPSIN